MKNRFRNNHFTLIELLVTIAIIALLAAIGMGAVKFASNKSQITKCRAQMHSLEMALNQYYDTYHQWPGRVYDNNMSGSNNEIFLTKEDWTTASKNGEKPDVSTAEKERSAKNGIYYYGVVSRLQGHNIRRRVFLPVQNNEPGTFVDPWGNNFTIYVSRKHNGRIVLTNSSYNDTVNGLYIPRNAEDNIIFHGNVLIVSKGPDGEYSAVANDVTNEDNLYSVVTTWSDNNGHEINQ